MRKSVLMLCCLAFAGAASALTVEWSWTPNGSDWDVENSSYYMVYSQNGNLTAEQLVAAAADKSGTPYKGIGANWGTTLDTTGKSKPEDAVVSEVGVGSAFAGDSTVYATFTDEDFPGTTGTANGYLYLVVFEKVPEEAAQQFAVATAGETGRVKIDNDGMTVDGATPGAAGYAPPVFFAGTSKAAPEPTAVALLALGIAGVALRRRVR